MRKQTWRIKAKALAACDPGGGHRRIKKRWRDDPSLMEFLRSSDPFLFHISLALAGDDLIRRPPLFM